MNHFTNAALIVCAAVTLAGCAGAAVDESTSPSAGALAPPLRPAEALIAAVESGDGAAVTAAVDAGADPNQTLKTGAPALYTAALKGQTEAVEALLAAGAEVDGRAPGGQTALMGACAAAPTELFAALLAAGADTDLASQAATGPKAIHICAQHGNVAGLEALVDAGVPVDQVEVTDGDALIYAGYYGQLEAARWLVEHGADPTLEDTANSTAGEWAKVNGFDEVAEYLDSVAE